MAIRNRCAHCEGIGTCKNDSGKSCAACVKRNKLGGSETGYCGLPCSICRGSGTVEPTSLKFQNRFTPVLASAFVGLAFIAIGVFGFFRETHFPAILAFAGTLIGSVTGFYFADRGEARRQFADTEVETAETDRLAPAVEPAAAGRHNA